MATWKKVITVDDDANYKNESITLAQLDAGLDGESNYGANKVLKVNGAGNAIVWADDNATTTLGALTDVSISSVADNEVLAYDNSSSEFINQTAAEAGLQTALTFGASNGNAVKVVTGIGADVDANDFAVFTHDAGNASAGIKGLSPQEARSAMSVAALAGSSSQNFAANDLTVAGDLTVTGTTISTATENIKIEDSVMTVNSGVASGNTAADGGFIVERGTDGDTAGLVGTDGHNVGIGFDESAGYFRFSSGSSTSAFSFVADIPSATNHATNTAPSNDDIGPIGSIHVATDSDAVYIRVD